MLRVPNVFLLSSNDAEVRAVTEALGRDANVVPVRTLTELKAQTADADCHALFCGWSFHKTRWKDSLNVVRILLNDVPVIFLSRPQDAEEWKAVLESGGFDLLLPPYTQLQARAVLGQALESYEARGRHQNNMPGYAMAS